MDLRKINWPSILMALAIFSVLVVPAAAQSDIYDLGTSVTTQDIRADSTGTVHLVWTYNNVLYYGRIVNKALTGKVQVATGVNTNFWRPYVSVRPGGESIHIAWCGGGGKRNQVMHSRRDGDGGWRTA